VQSELADEVALVDEWYGLNLAARWGWDIAGTSSAGAEAS
jgi:hypothetical protein